MGLVDRELLVRMFGCEAGLSSVKDRDNGYRHEPKGLCRGSGLRRSDTALAVVSKSNVLD